MVELCRDAARWAWDTFRTAPLYELGGMFSVFAGFSNFIVENKSLINYLAIGTCFCVACSFDFAAREMDNERKRIEESIGKIGWSYRLIEPCMKWWCNRQVAKVVSDRFGSEGDFERALDSAKKKGKVLDTICRIYPVIPNF